MFKYARRSLRWPSSTVGSSANELDIAEGVDARVEQAADDSRGFVFDDDRGAWNEGAGLKVAAVVDRHFDELAGLRVEDGAAARRLRRVGLPSRRCGLALGRDRRGKQHYPTEDFNLDAGDDAAVKAAIFALECVAERRCIVAAIRAGRQCTAISWP